MELKPRPPHTPAPGDPEWNLLGQRLRLARRKSGLSLRSLAEATQGLASHETIRQFENGVKIPSPETLEAFCRIFGVTLDHLMTPQLSLGEVEFRKRARTTSEDRVAVRHEILDLLERYLEIEDLLELDDQWAPPSLEVSCSNQDESYAEEMAMALRDHWKLGLAPIHDFTKLLEEKGLKVLLPQANVESISGLTCEVHRDGRPSVFVIVVNRHQSLERRRFKLGHELGHRLLNFEGLSGKGAESLCNRIAGAFLVPAVALREETGPHPHSPLYEEIMLAKHYFRVSATMLVMRLEQVGCIELWQRDKIFKTFGQGWRTAEPDPLELPSAKQEMPRFRRLVYQALACDFISIEKAADLLLVPVREVHRHYHGPIYGEG